MIKGKDKIFVRGNTFAFTRQNKNNKEGKYCLSCGAWKTSKLFRGGTTYCNSCNS